MSAAERALLNELREAIPPPAAKGRGRRPKRGASEATARCGVTLPAGLADSFRALCAAQQRTQRRKYPAGLGGLERTAR